MCLVFACCLWMTRVAQYILLVRRCLKILHSCFLASANLSLTFTSRKWRIEMLLICLRQHSAVQNVRAVQVFTPAVNLQFVLLFSAWHFCRGGLVMILWTAVVLWNTWARVVVEPYLSSVCKEANQTLQNRWVLNGGTSVLENKTSYRRWSGKGTHKYRRAGYN